MPHLLDLEHLVDALKGFKRPSSEGRLAIENLIVVGTERNDSRSALVHSLCLRTTKIDEPPCSIKVLIDKEAKAVQDRIKEIDCSCPAGASKEHVCKHAFATLMYLERNDESMLKVLTCTDLEQVWGTCKDLVSQRFSPLPLVDFCCVKKPDSPYKRPVKEVTEDMEKRFRAMFIADQPESEAAIFLSGIRAPAVVPANPNSSSDETLLKNILKRAVDEPHHLLNRTAEIAADLLSKCSPEEQEYYKNNVAVTAGESVHMCVDTVGQESDLWLMFKRGRFTGSISYSMYTYTKNKNAQWEKRFQSTFNSGFQGNSDTARGLKYEEDSRLRFERDHPGLKAILSGIFVHPLVPWLGYSPDAIVCEGGVPIKLLECKVPAKGEKFDAKHIVPHVTYFDKKRDNQLKKKHPYYGQVQLGMVLLNLPAAEFTVYCVCSDENHYDTVTLDESFLLDFLDSLAKCFFQKLLPWLVMNPSN